jgi:DNA-directed RNA polymerase specialized sigma24 family protein
MINAHVADAVQILQRRNRQYFYSSSYWTERTDRAIDIILRSPDSSKPPSHIVRNALSDARKVIHRRRQVCSIIEAPKQDKDEQLEQSIEAIPDSSINSIEAVFAIKDWFERARLKDKDRAVLSILLEGGEAEDVAKYLNLSIKQARVCISRARKSALALWKEDIHV